MSTLSPELLPPGGGARKLTAKEAMQRMQALSCTLPKDSTPKCSGQVFVGIFFDGTGNNMKADYETPPPAQRKHTNVVKLFIAHKDARHGGYRAYYIPGVGTPFPEIGDTGGTFGSGTASGGEERIIWAFTRLINAPYSFVFPKAQLISDEQAKTISSNLSGSTNPAALRRAALRNWQEKLKAAIEGKKPAVEQINLSIYGFSRGAAQARAFANWLFEVCDAKDGGYAFAGIPIRLNFMGLFDTVASVGNSNLFESGLMVGHVSWADNNLMIHPAIERCVHFVAAHEVRACFPLDSVRVKNSYPSNALEVMYPGAHSDLGGGYAPGALGVSPSQDSFMAIVPGANMYREAVMSGVPLLPLTALGQNDAQALTPSDKLVADFNAYMVDAKIGSGAIEEMHRRNMGLYFSHRFKYRADYFQRVPYTSAKGQQQGYMRQTQDCLIARLAALRKKWNYAVPEKVNPMDPNFDPSARVDGYENELRTINAQDRPDVKSLCEVARRIQPKSLTPAIEIFFDTYLHDSMAGFIEQLNEYRHNRIGFVKFRTIFYGND